MRIVRLVARVAGHAARCSAVTTWGNSGLGGVLFVAAAAESWPLPAIRVQRTGIVGMLRQWPVARLARDVGMFAGRSKLGLVVMAAYKYPARIGNRVLADVRPTRPGDSARTGQTPWESPLGVALKRWQWRRQAPWPPERGAMNLDANRASCPFLLLGRHVSTIMAKTTLKSLIIADR